MYFSAKKTLFFLIFTGIIAGEADLALARWANYHDAEIEIESSKRTLYINKDGVGHEIYEARKKLLKERAKASWVNYTYPYNSNREIVKILEAFTLNNGKKYHVNPSKIKKQSVVPSIEYPSNETKIIIPYSNLKIGSTVYLKSEVIDLVPQLENCYSTYFTFGNQSYTHSASVSVKSELPLQISINDPDKILNIKESIKKEKNKILYCLEIHQKKPVYKDIIDEEKTHFNLKYVPIVSIQAMPTSTHSGKIKAIEYAKIKNQALPVLYQKIANIAKTKSTAIDKIDTVTALLHENITYTINPKYCVLPQPLQQVVDTGYGDCKDFSVATCAILQAIGISAKIVTVRSGEMDLPFPSDLPGHGANHAIVKVELPEGPLWVDPTYPVGMAKYISVNIANRKATVLHDDYATYEDIPSMKLEDYRLIKHETWDMKDPSQIHIPVPLQDAKIGECRV